MHRIKLRFLGLEIGLGLGLGLVSSVALELGYVDWAKGFWPLHSHLRCAPKLINGPIFASNAIAVCIAEIESLRNIGCTSRLGALTITIEFNRLSILASLHLDLFFLFFDVHPQLLDVLN
jgi:hypothetical protein